MILETYGNIEVHSKTNEAMVDSAKALLKDLAKDHEGVGKIFDLSLMKFKERDEVEVSRRGC